jgi:hypothetical protein
MITIGIRAAPKVVTFAIYDTDEEAILNVEEIKIPAAFDTPSALKYVRSNLLDVLREYQVERAGVRITEALATPNVERIQIEGVIQEAFASTRRQRLLGVMNEALPEHGGSRYGLGLHGASTRLAKAGAGSRRPRPLPCEDESCQSTP